MKPARAPAEPDCTPFEHEVVVRPGDVDFAGHLNHVAIVGLFEYGRVRAHRDVRLAHPELPDMGTVVRHVSVEYHGQAAMFEPLLVRTWVRRDGTTSRTWAQELVRRDDVLVATAEVTSVLLDRSTGRPASLPALYRDLFAAHRERARG